MLSSKSVGVSNIVVFIELSLVIMVMDVLLLVLLPVASSFLQVKLRKRARRNLKSCKIMSVDYILNMHT